MADLTEVQLGVDELEALRLKDVVGLDQEECAERMNLTQSTFQRILAAARQKVSKAIVEGRALRVEGGNYQFVQRWLCRSCSSVFEAAAPPEGEGGMTCPSCEGNQLDNLSSRGNGWGRPPWAGAGRGRRRGGRG